MADRLFKKRITNTVLLLIVILLYSVTTVARTRDKPTLAKPFKGQIYRAIDDKKVITIISPDELEFKEHDLNLVCKYSKRDDTLRVVYSMMGTTQALYFRIIPNVGLESEDGVILYSPKPYESVMQEIETQRLQKYLNVEFLKASKEGDLPKLKELLTQGAKINTYDKEGMGFSALIFAAKGGHLDVVNFLIERGADPNYKTSHGITALMAAANEGGQHGFVNLPRSAEHDKIVEILCKHSDVINAQNIPEGYTALMHALFRNNNEAVRILINNGSDLYIKDAKGKTALDYNIPSELLKEYYNTKKREYAPYYKHIKDKIRLYWLLQYGTDKSVNQVTSEDKPVIVTFKVFPSGKIVNVKIADTAGNELLASKVQASIQNTPLDKFPEYIRDNYLNVSFSYFFE